MVSIQLFFLVTVVVMVMRVRSQQHCAPPVQSQTGFALIGTQYYSTHTKDYPACLMVCKRDSNCMSLNYLLTTKTCDLNTQTKESRAELYQQRTHSIYSTTFRTPKPMKGMEELPGKSCLDILVSGDSIGTGVYWIDPPNTGSPIKALCDMETDRGGWTIVKKLVLQSPKIVSKLSLATYHVIASYDNNDKNVMPTSAAMLDIKQKMGFHQIHFYCHKKSTGRVVSIVTKNNTAGQQVLRYFTYDAYAAQKNFPAACGSFDLLAEDTSVLAQNCAQWGRDGTWSASSFTGGNRVVSRPFKMHDKFFGCTADAFSCDDNTEIYNVNDKWQVAVR